MGHGNKMEDVDSLLIAKVIYMFFVLLVMLNMLLAIILERYTEVAHHLSNQSDARTLLHRRGNR